MPTGDQTPQPKTEKGQMSVENIDWISVIILVCAIPAAMYGLFKLVMNGLFLLPWVGLLIIGGVGVYYGATNLEEPSTAAFIEEIEARLNDFDLKSYTQTLCEQLE